MALIDKIDDYLYRNKKQWISAKQAAAMFRCPLSSATSALSTIYRFDDYVERERRLTDGKYRKRKVWYYRRT